MSCWPFNILQFIFVTAIFIFLNTYVIEITQISRLPDDVVISFKTVLYILYLRIF